MSNLYWFPVGAEAVIVAEDDSIVQRHDRLLLADDRLDSAEWLVWRSDLTDIFYVGRSPDTIPSDVIVGRIVVIERTHSVPQVKP